MSKLNHKQLKLLNEMSAEQLVNLVCILAENNKQTKYLLVNNYLLSADESLKRAGSEYKRKLNARRSYDYHAAAAFFDDMYRNIVLPVKNTVSILPAKVELFCENLLLTFDKISEIADTSSGSWIQYYNGVADVWLKSIALQKDREVNIVVDKMMFILECNAYFDFKLFKRHKKELGNDIICALRKRFVSQNVVNTAIELSLYISDIDFIRESYKNGMLKSPEHIIKFADLLIVRLCAEEAIQVLNETKSVHSGSDSGLQDKWTETYIQALIEQGKIQQAKELCIQGFNNRCNINFYNIYNRLDDSDASQDIFFYIARSRGFAFVVLFLFQINDYKKLDNEIVNAGENLSDVLALLRDSFIRSLSSELYRYNYPVSAILLRRVLIEACINRAQSKYYWYAASDMKESIDYSKNITGTTLVSTVEEYFEILFMTHKRKQILWDIMQEKIEGITIGKDTISYSE